MSIVLFIITLLTIFMPYVFRLFYQKIIPEEFTLTLPSLWQSVFNNLYMLLIAIALFIIGKAFQKGYKLQQEQDLTI